MICLDFHVESSAANSGELQFHHLDDNFFVLVVNNSFSYARVVIHKDDLTKLIETIKNKVTENETESL